ncbi:MAG: hypothetical protein WKF40_06165 [Thermoleophilaceae bacterium]
MGAAHDGRHEDPGHIDDDRAGDGGRRNAEHRRIAAGAARRGPAQRRPARRRPRPSPGADGARSARWSAGADGPVLAWQAITDGGEGHLYDVLVDARDGALLRRQDLTQHLGQSRYFPRDPDLTPAPTQLTMPPAWYDDNAGGTRLRGQFSRT